jgi:opacity protein-like surface antigen
MKSILMVAALAVASLSVVSAKTYDIILTNPALAGQTKLAPGHYTVKVNGSNAEFRNTDSSHTTSVPVKIENGSTKFGHTAVDTKKDNGVEQIESIELRDTNTKLEF